MRALFQIIGRRCDRQCDSECRAASGCGRGADDSVGRVHDLAHYGQPEAVALGFGRGHRTEETFQVVSAQSRALTAALIIYHPRRRLPEAPLPRG